MKPATFALCAFLLAAAGADPASARQKTDPAQVDQWATCAAEKNAGDVTWLYMIQSNQSGLKGRQFDGAAAYALSAMIRDCVPDGTILTNKVIDALSTKAFSLWSADTGRPSTKRETDPWADCMAENHPAKANAFLFATDVSFAGGPNIIVEGVDAVEGLFEPSQHCDRVKTVMTASDRIDVYARLNYLIRVKPRLQPAAPAKPGGGKP